MALPQGGYIYTPPTVLYNQAPVPTFIDSAPASTYQPAPAPTYQPAPAPTYQPAPAPTYQPVPTPTYSSTEHICGRGLVRKADGSCTRGIVTRNLYLYEGPSETIHPATHYPSPKVINAVF